MPFKSKVALFQLYCMCVFLMDTRTHTHTNTNTQMQAHFPVHCTGSKAKPFAACINCNYSDRYSSYNRNHSNRIIFTDKNIKTMMRFCAVKQQCSLASVELDL